MQKTPKSLRLHIGLFGRRNTGKSSLLNAITRQNVSIVSDVAGTTTDPVEKPMEMLPLGPVLFIDTAGIDDIGALGEMRVKKTRKVFERTDIAIIITTGDVWGEFEEDLICELCKNEIPYIVVFNKSDISSVDEKIKQKLSDDKTIFIETSAICAEGVEDLREALIQKTPSSFLEPKTIIGDLIPPGELVLLVVPIDMEAPKGRLIMPQVQTIRDTLDNDSYCMVVKERELKAALERLNKPPALVITDSQAFLKVAADVPDEIPMTSFSILFARFKGDLDAFIDGANAIESLSSGDKILIAESCSHHPIGEDIGRVKIPRWLTQYVGGKLEIGHMQGNDFPENLSEYKLVIHCGGCTFNRAHILTRIQKCKNVGVPITNYGLAISYSLGIFDRALRIFNR